jgi:hypothetical protein
MVLVGFLHFDGPPPNLYIVSSANMLHVKYCHGYKWQERKGR